LSRQGLRVDHPYPYDQHDPLTRTLRLAASIPTTSRVWRPTTLHIAHMVAPSNDVAPKRLSQASQRPCRNQQLISEWTRFPAGTTAHRSSKRRVGTPAAGPRRRPRPAYEGGGGGTPRDPSRIRAPPKAQVDVPPCTTACRRFRREAHSPAHPPRRAVTANSVYRMVYKRRVPRMPASPGVRCNPTRRTSMSGSGRACRAQVLAMPLQWTAPYRWLFPGLARWACSTFTNLRSSRRSGRELRKDRSAFGATPRHGDKRLW